MGFPVQTVRRLSSRLLAVACFSGPLGFVLQGLCASVARTFCSSLPAGGVGKALNRKRALGVMQKPSSASRSSKAAKDLAASRSQGRPRARGGRRCTALVLCQDSRRDFPLGFTNTGTASPSWSLWTSNDVSDGQLNATFMYYLAWLDLWLRVGSASLWAVIVVVGSGAMGLLFQEKFSLAVIACAIGFFLLLVQLFLKWPRLFDKGGYGSGGDPEAWLQIGEGILVGLCRKHVVFLRGGGFCGSAYRFVNRLNCLNRRWLGGGGLGYPYAVFSLPKWFFRLAAWEGRFIARVLHSSFTVFYGPHKMRTRRWPFITKALTRLAYYLCRRSKWF